MARGGRSSGGRSSGGGKSGSTSSKSMFSTSMFSTSSASAAKSNPPPPAKSPRPRAYAPTAAPAQQSTGESFLGHLGRTMLEGASFGAGNAMSRMAVNSIFGGSSQHLPAEHSKVADNAAPTEVAKEYTGVCASDHTQLIRCMNNKGESDCTFYFSSLQQCLSDSKAKQNEF